MCNNYPCAVVSRVWLLLHLVSSNQQFITESSSEHGDIKLLTLNTGIVHSCSSSKLLKATEMSAAVCLPHGSNE